MLKILSCSYQQKIRIYIVYFMLWNTKFTHYLEWTSYVCMSYERTLKNVLPFISHQQSTMTWVPSYLSSVELSGQDIKKMMPHKQTWCQWRYHFWVRTRWLCGWRQYWKWQQILQCWQRWCNCHDASLTWTAVKQTKICFI